MRDFLSRLLDYLGVAALVVTALGFGVWNYLFYTAPDRPDATHTERVSIYMSTSNKTVYAYMSPSKRQVYDALGNTFAISFVAFFGFLLGSVWLKRKNSPKRNQ